MNPEIERRITELQEILGDELRRVLDWSVINTDELFNQIQQSISRLNTFNPKNPLALTITTLNDNQWICVIQGAAESTAQLLASANQITEKEGLVYAKYFKTSFNELANGLTAVRPFSTGSRR